ncbi:metalloregulator ArsR/SmtB family transcription factor [uncultured Parolsenella sp.]|uniref:ArsR/SmtB family transcription factor n=1 Tax=uncultured Parolsenella sp. TaxID=2083008 RepID=UPI0027D9BCF3|nr:metalloregulator ArsR/SmtB family transcription factor [uncultured Parolsenella sp.]
MTDASHTPTAANLIEAAQTAPSQPSDADDTQRCPIPVGEAPENIPDEELLYDLADLFKVFSDTTRIKILFTLMGRDLCVADIADETGTTQSAVSHQLRTLKQAHLVKFERDGRNIVYSLADDHVYTMLNVGLSHICE